MVARVRFEYQGWTSEDPYQYRFNKCDTFSRRQGRGVLKQIMSSYLWLSTYIENLQRFVYKVGSKKETGHKLSNTGQIDLNCCWGHPIFRGVWSRSSRRVHVVLFLPTTHPNLVGDGHHTIPNILVDVSVFIECSQGNKVVSLGGYFIGTPDC